MAEEADASFDVGEIEKLFTKAKSSGEPYTFAFGLASKPEECGFAVHMRKAGAALKKDLKGSSKSIKKVCFGTFTVDGGDVRLSCDKPIKGIVKQLKKRFRDAGMMKYKPMLVGPDGVEIDEETLPDDYEDDEDDDAVAPEGAAAPVEGDSADDGADDGAPAPAEAAPEAPDLGALKARLMAIRPQLDTVAKEQAGPLVAAFTKAVGQVKEGDAAGAGGTLDLIERALARLGGGTGAPPPAPPPPPAPDAAARLTQALVALVGRIKALPAGPAQTACAVQARTAQGLIASDPAKAVEAIRALAAAVAQAEAGGGGQAGTGEAPATKASPIDIWNEAKEKVDVGIGALQGALRGVGHPDTDRIAELGLAGLSGGGTQTALVSALMSYNITPPADRAKASGAVRQAIGAYRGFLGSNRLVVLCENNPFGVAVDIRGTLGGALDRIEAALAA